MSHNIQLGLIMFFWLHLATVQITGQLHAMYVGCFLGNIDDDDTEHILINSNTLTVELCIQKCYDDTNQAKSQMTFAALSDGRRCDCLNNHGHQFNARNCNVRCSGDPFQICGGSQSTQVYSLYTVCNVGHFGPKCDQLCRCKRHLPCDRTIGICPDGCDEHWTGMNCNISDIQKQFQGCYVGAQNWNQSMDVESPVIKTTANDTISAEFCIQRCSTNNYTYALIQPSFDCYCEETFNIYENETYDGKQINCSVNCSANVNQTCESIDARRVYLVCPVGFYGKNCVNRCYCSDGGRCRFNGTCLNSTLGLCKPGWTGSACNIRDCEISNGDCGPDEMCESVDLGFAHSSVCRCKDGFYRDKNTCRPSCFHYVGCYREYTTQFVDVELPEKDIHVMTIEVCILRCSKLNKTYSFIQGGEKCLCGNSYGQIARDDDCHVPCAGNKQQYCGGRNMVDETSFYVVYTARSFLRGYIGCYKDNFDRAMIRMIRWQNLNNTIDFCTEYCASYNYMYAGLQYSYVCFCGNSYDRYGPLPESRCNMTCTGNSSQICGGDYANSVYAVDTDISGCSSDAVCKLNDACTEIDMNYITVSRCRCKQGFSRIRNWQYCTDVDECRLGTSSCNTTSENCVNTLGSYRCECSDGFLNVSGTCEDIDECKNASLVCEIESEQCTNTAGSYICNCKPGYESTYYGICADVDECHLVESSSRCNINSEHCVNSIGSYFCSCMEGFTRTFGICQESSFSPSTGIMLGTFLAISLLINVLFVVHLRSSIKSANKAKCTTQSDLQPSFRQRSVGHEVIYDVVLDPVERNDIYEQIEPEQRQNALSNRTTAEYEELKQCDYVNVE